MKKRYVIPVFSHRDSDGYVDKSVYFMHEPHHTYAIARDNGIDMCGGDPHSLFTKRQITQMTHYYHSHQNKNQYYTNLLRSVFVINSLYNINSRLADYCWDIISDDGKKIISEHHLIDIIKKSGLAKHVTIPDLVAHNVVLVNHYNTMIRLADKHARAQAHAKSNSIFKDSDSTLESTYDHDALATKPVFISKLNKALATL